MFENISLKTIRVDNIDYIKENNTDILKRTKPPESNNKNRQIIISTDRYIVNRELELKIRLLIDKGYGERDNIVWVHEDRRDNRQIIEKREVIVKANIEKEVKIPILGEGYGVVYASLNDEEGYGNKLRDYTVSNYLVFYAIGI